MEKKCTVFLISGKARTGKDTAGEYIREKAFGSQTIRAWKEAFAERVKEIATESFDWNGEKDQKGRQLLINIGQMGREYNPNYWVDIIGNKLLSNFHWRANQPYTNYLVTITDWRFVNEKDRLIEILENSIIPTSVISLRMEGPQRIISGEYVNTSSVTETELDNYPHFDYVIYNDQDIQHLHNQLDIILNKHS